MSGIHTKREITFPPDFSPDNMAVWLYQLWTNVNRTILFAIGISLRLAAEVIQAQPLISRTAIVKQLLDPFNYDYTIPPKFNEDEPIDVTIGLYINNFDTINDQTMDYSVSIFLRMNWVDERLAFSRFSNDTRISLDPRVLDRVWIPDLFFPNEKKAHLHDVMLPNRYLRISPDGAIAYSTRVSLKLSCKMTLYKFPLDTQTCSIDLESYAYDIEKVIFAWMRASHPPVEIPDVELPQFQLVDHKVASFVRNYTTGRFSALQVCFVLRRDIGFYMIHTYVPSVLIVILSWVSFWISADAVPARISLGVTTVLTMTTQSSGVTSSTPKVSYVKAIDVWMFTCLLFVFGALLEFALVNVLGRNKIKLQYRKHVIEMKASTEAEKFQTLLGSENTGKPVCDHTDLVSLISADSARVDVISRYAFPLAFVTFNSIYWLSYYYMADPVVSDTFRN